jgi:hypothetical protein
VATSAQCEEEGIASPINDSEPKENKVARDHLKRHIRNLLGHVLGEPAGFGEIGSTPATPWQIA